MNDQEIDLTNEIEDLAAAYKREQEPVYVMIDVFGQPIPGVYLSAADMRTLHQFDDVVLKLQILGSSAILLAIALWYGMH